MPRRSQRRARTTSCAAGSATSAWSSPAGARNLPGRRVAILIVGSAWGTCSDTLLHWPKIRRRCHEHCSRRKGHLVEDVDDVLGISSLHRNRAATSNQPESDTSAECF